MLGGRPALLRRFEWTAAGQRQISQLQGYCVDDRLGFVATATAESSGFDLVEPQLKEILAGLRLTALGYPVPRVGASPQDNDERTLRMLQRGELDGSWVLPVAAAGDLKHLVGVGFEYTVDELEALAGLIGGSSFPGVIEDAQSGEKRDGKLEAGRRSLLVRGIVAIADGGEAVVAEPHCFLFGVAFRPQEFLSVQQMRVDESTSRVYYSRSEISVEHAYVAPGIHRLAGFPRGELGPRLIDFMRLSKPARQVKTHGSVRMSARLLPRVAELVRAQDTAQLATVFDAEARPLMDALKDFVSWSTIRCLKYEGQRVVGEEFAWLDTGRSGSWLVDTAKPPTTGQEPEATVIKTTPEELVDRLKTLLVGAAVPAKL
jgi:hypothetical protein